ncbi:expressed unknown protein [Seminavis robusta]|uniref:Uncharacterized protein n=1 Tax=Seminavis robusta TaxID=568900 RepID=A0A9N8E479_9STRA|nr:expressed unknown protein [Seminavis robusta]|eukprot:Sro639_g179770.1 n/a (302) ;mRNA; r:37503-38408
MTSQELQWFRQEQEKEFIELAVKLSIEAKEKEPPNEVAPALDISAHTRRFLEEEQEKELVEMAKRLSLSGRGYTCDLAANVKHAMREPEQDDPEELEVESPVNQESSIRAQGGRGMLATNKHFSVVPAKATTKEVKPSNQAMISLRGVAISTFEQSQHKTACHQENDKMQEAVVNGHHDQIDKPTTRNSIAQLRLKKPHLFRRSLQARGRRSPATTQSPASLVPSPVTSSVTGKEAHKPAKRHSCSSSIPSSGGGTGLMNHSGGCTFERSSRSRIQKHVGERSRRRQSCCNGRNSQKKVDS